MFRKLNILQELFIEPCLKPNPDIDIEIYENWLRILNFSHYLIEVDQHTKTLLPNSQCFLRQTITTNKKNLSDLNSRRYAVDLLIFYCTNPDATKWACQDQRIDSLIFNPSNIHLLADDSTINLLKINNKAIDINTFELVSKLAIGPIRNVRKAIYKAVKKDVPILLSSNANNPQELRSQQSVIAFSHFLDIPVDYYSEISQKWLYSRLLRNQKRRTNSDFVAPNIWEIENGVE